MHSLIIPAYIFILLLEPKTHFYDMHFDAELKHTSQYGEESPEMQMVP